MKAASFAFTRALAIILAFVLGFLSFGGVLFGVGYYVYTKVSIDALDSLGVHIDTDSVIDEEAAEVSLTAITIKDLVSEIKTIVAESSNFSMETLIDRYGLKIPGEYYEYVPSSVRELPFATLFSKEGLDTILSSVYVGTLLDYKQTEGGWTDHSGTPIDGIYATLADYTLHELINGGFDVEKFTTEITVADIYKIQKKENLPVYIKNGVGLTPVTDLAEPIEVWCDANNAPVDSIINAIAGFSISQIETDLDTLMIADITGLTSYGDEWYSWEYVHTEAGEYIALTPNSDITAELAHITIAEVSDGHLQEEIDGIEISSFMRYTYDEENDRWLNKDNEPISGVMAAIADSTVGELDTSIDSIKLGEVSNYIPVESVDEDGNTVTTWYESYDEENPEECVVASGILGKLADMTIEEMTDESALTKKIETLTVADALNYDATQNESWKEGDAEYKKYTYTKDGAPVTGVMAVIAGTELTGIQDTIDTASMGDILGYEYRTGENGKPTYAEDGITVIGYTDWWFDENGDPIHTLMNSVSNKNFDELGSLPSELTIADIIPEEERESGYIKLVPADTTVENISLVVNDVFTNKTIYDFVEAGAISLEGMTDEQKALYNTPDSDFGKLTIGELMIEALILHEKVEKYEELLGIQ